MRSILTALAAALCVTSAALATAQSSNYQVIEVPDAGRIVGRVTMAGTAPARERLAVTTDKEVCSRTEKLSEALVVSADGGVANALVYLRDIARGKSWQNPDELVQTDCVFSPHILLAPEGADMHIVNNDRIAHQVRSAGNLLLNVVQPRYVVKLLVPEFAKGGSPEMVINVWCDIHPWMHAHIVMERHPYYVLTNVDGAFRLTGVPPGQYELAVWHETLGKATRQVTVNPNAETPVSFNMELGSPPVLEHRGRTGTP